MGQFAIKQKDTKMAATLEKGVSYIIFQLLCLVDSQFMAPLSLFQMH